MAGYSGTPLPKKLGITGDSRVLVVDAPDGFALDGVAFDGLAFDGLDADTQLGSGSYDVILAFCRDYAALAARFDQWRAALTTAGGLWIAWPKKSSGMATDLGDDVVRRFGLAEGLVDNKVCAIDATWSGLRFVVRRADR